MHTSVPTSSAAFGPYEACAVVAGLSTGSLPLLLLFPGLLPALTGVPAMDGPRLAQLSGFVAAVTPLAAVYVYALATRSLTLLDVATCWRLGWVTPWVLASVATGGLEPAAAIPIVGVDVGSSAVAWAFDARARLAEPPARPLHP